MIAGVTISIPSQHERGPLSVVMVLKVTPLSSTIVDKDPHMLLTTGILQQLTTPFAIGTNTVLSLCLL